MGFLRLVRGYTVAVARLGLAILRSLGWPDLLIPAGFVCLVYGVAQISPPAAWIIGGLVLLVAGGWLAHSERKRGRV